ncbi:MAG: hypothetical protein IJA82_06510 [Clostridia bacterium]|nr:hypothetical protein [Clostridia bacterium]
MAQFTNQAQLTYRDVVTNSNVAVGETLEVLSISKTALVDTYTQGDSVTYIISLINSSGTDLNGITITDNLGAYEFGGGTLVPLTYIDGSLRYYTNGVLQPELTTDTTDGLTISGVTIPANGNAILVYETNVNGFAPLVADSTITNTAVASGNGIAPISASETITAVSTPRLTITKSISPVPVAENGIVTYTFLIQNTGNVPVVATDNSFVTDLFNPILSDLSVSFNGQGWTEGTEYNYNEVTGLFETVPSNITVPSATYTQDPTTGVWSVTPGASTLVVSGRL